MAITIVISGKLEPMSSSFLAHEVAGPQASAPPVQPLLTPFRMGDLSLRNRVVMAPLTRMRARPDNHVPSALQAEYYAQRARAGLIVTEATAISPEASAGQTRPVSGAKSRSADGDSSPMPFTTQAVASSPSFGIPARCLIQSCAMACFLCRHRM